jgi:protein disulfide-isomerase
MKTRIMKKIIFLLACSFMIGTIAAQAPTQYTAHNKGWLVDLDEAYNLSKNTGKPIMANFTGSDWCGWCKRLTAAVFAKPEFKKWANDNVILLELDFPRRFKIPEKYRKQNAGLQQALGIRGYPTVWVFTASKDASSGRYNLNPMGKTGYKPSVQEFTNEVDQILAKKSVSARGSR